MVHIVRYGHEYDYSTAGFIDAAADADRGTPDAWIYFSGRWPNRPEAFPAFFDDLMEEMEAMAGGSPDRCRWDPADPYFHQH